MPLPDNSLGAFCAALVVSMAFANCVWQWIVGLSEAAGRSM